MRPLIPSILLIFFLEACASKPSSNAPAIAITPASILHKSIDCQYGEAIYRVTFDTDSTMHWEAIAGNEKGAKKDETYTLQEIGPNMLFISWGEANGIGVAQILDFNKGKVYNHLLRGRKVSKGIGQLIMLP